MTAPDDGPELCCPHEDDPAIPDEALLYRRLPKYNVKPAADATLGYRMTSNAYHDKDPQGISVYVAELLTERGMSAADIVADREAGWGVAETTAGRARISGFGVRLRPDPAVVDDPRNAAHAELTGLRAAKGGERQAKELTKPPGRLVLVHGAGESTA